MSTKQSSSQDKAQANLKQAKAKIIKAKPKRILARTKKSKPQPLKFSKNDLTKDIIRNAKVLGISDKVSARYADNVSDRISQWVRVRGIVTTSDINKKVAQELEKYNQDLAFIYKQKGKII